MGKAVNDSDPFPTRSTGSFLNKHLSFCPIYEDKPHPTGSLGGDRAYMIFTPDKDAVSQHFRDSGRNSVCSVVIDGTRLWVFNPKDTAGSYRPKTDGMPPLSYP